MKTDPVISWKRGQRAPVTPNLPCLPLCRSRYASNNCRVWITQAILRGLTDDICRELGIYPLPEGLRISVVVPVYNEKATVAEIVRRIRAVPISKEIILVDDASTDGTRDVLATLDCGEDLRIVLHQRNRGKGAALRTGFAQATGDIVIVQDADLEYDPRQYLRLIQPIVEGVADVVYGSRFLSVGPHRVLYFWHYVANRGADDALEHVYRSEPHRHGNLL